MTPRLRIRLRTLVLAGALSAQQATAPALLAQQARVDVTTHPGERRVPRRVLMPFVMGAAAALAASAYFVGSAEDPVGSCTGPSCVLPMSIGIGLFVGYLMGREMDQAFALRYRRGAPVAPTAQALMLEGEPQWLAVSAQRGAAGGTGGVQLFATDGAPRLLARRAVGIRGIHGVALTPSSVLVAAATGLYEFAADSAIGMRVRDGDVTACTELRGRHVVAIGERLELSPPPGRSDSTWRSTSAGAPVRALATDDARGVVWVATDSSLGAFTLVGDSLTRQSSVRLTGGVRTVRTDGSRVAVAAGERGLWLFDVEGGTSARVRFVWTGTRFAYDALITRERLFVAAGGEGLFVLDARAARGAVLGIARQTGFAVALGEQGDYTYVLDRTSPALHRIRSDFSLR